METPQTPQQSPQEQLAALEEKMAAEAATNEGMPNETDVATAAAANEAHDAHQAYRAAVDDAHAVRIEARGIMGEVSDAVKNARRAAPPVRRPTPTSSAKVNVHELDLEELRRRIATMNGS